MTLRKERQRKTNFLGWLETRLQYLLMQELLATQGQYWCLGELQGSSGALGSEIKMSSTLERGMWTLGKWGIGEKTSPFM